MYCDVLLLPWKEWGKFSPTEKMDGWQENRRKKWINKSNKSHVSFLATNAHQWVSTNVIWIQNDNGIPCGGHATKPPTSAMNIFMWKLLNCVDGSTLNAISSIFFLSPYPSFTISLPFFAAFQCEPIIVEPLFSIFKHCIWIELIDVHSMSI